MSRMEKQFAAMLGEGLTPVTPDEVIRPTRVVWRGQAGQVRTRVFPTEARAVEFAITIPGSEIADVTEPVPPQPETARNGFHRHVIYSEGRVHRAYRARRQASP